MVAAFGQLANQTGRHLRNFDWHSGWPSRGWANLSMQQGSSLLIFVLIGLWFCKAWCFFSSARLLCPSLWLATEATNYSNLNPSSPLDELWTKRVITSFCSLLLVLFVWAHAMCTVTWQSCYLQSCNSELEQCCALSLKEGNKMDKPMDTTEKNSRISNLSF